MTLRRCPGALLQYALQRPRGASANPIMKIKEKIKAPPAGAERKAPVLSLLLLGEREQVRERDRSQITVLLAC